MQEVSFPLATSFLSCTFMHTHTHTLLLYCHLCTNIHLYLKCLTEPAECRRMNRFLRNIAAYVCVRMCVNERERKHKHTEPMS